MRDLVELGLRLPSNRTRSLTGQDINARCFPTKSNAALNLPAKRRICMPDLEANATQPAEAKAGLTFAFS